ncbi:hypothetical protein RugamoR57_07800 [Duganella caerulea]
MTFPLRISYAMRAGFHASADAGTPPLITVTAEPDPVKLPAPNKKAGALDLPHVGRCRAAQAQVG